jgi:hypothetical protein
MISSVIKVRGEIKVWYNTGEKTALSSMEQQG